MNHLKKSNREHKYRKNRMNNLKNCLKVKFMSNF